MLSEAGDVATRRFMTLDPSTAVVIVLGGLFLGIFLGGLFETSGSPGVGFLLRQVIITLLFLGWPLLVGTAVERHVDRRSSRGGVLALIALPYMFVSVAVFVSLPPHTHPILRFLVGLFVIPGGLASSYLLYFGSKTLVAAELRRPVRLDHYFGTLLLFLVLPVGAFFLQKRLNKLLSALEAEE